MKITIDYDTTTFLNAREKFVLTCLINGMTIDEIANSGQIGFDSNGIRHILRKIDIKLGLGLDIEEDA